MQIIITDSRSSRSRTLNFSITGLLLIMLLLVMVGAAGMYFMRASNLQAEQSQLLAQQAQQQRLEMEDVARKVGEMQARLVQLQTLADQVAERAGVPAENTGVDAQKEQPGQGGALVDARPVLKQELLQMLDRMDLGMTKQSDLLMFADASLFDARLGRSMIPTQEPVPGKRAGSSFGRRIDPITGSSAMHTGLDFQAPTGTPIYAAAGGIVITEQFHAAYGNMLEIDHGNELVTRYAHASQLLVKRGDVVKRGQLIAKVGTTGRSTGPHLHFEVLAQGSQQDPQKFLDAGSRADWRKIVAAKSK